MRKKVKGPFKMKKFSGFGEGTGKKSSPAKLGFLGGLNIPGYSAMGAMGGSGGSAGQPPTPVSSGAPGGITIGSIPGNFGTASGTPSSTPVTPPASTPSNTRPRGRKNRGGTRRIMRRR